MGLDLAGIASGISTGLNILSGASAIGQMLFGKSKTVTTLGAYTDYDILSAKRYMIGISELSLLQRKYGQSGVLYERFEFARTVDFVVLGVDYELNGGELHFYVRSGASWIEVEPMADQGNPYRYKPVDVRTSIVDIMVTFTRGSSEFISPVIKNLRVYGLNA